jgi:hypothetical protein
MEVLTFNNVQDLEEQVSLKHVVPTILFSPYFIHACMKCLNMIPIYDVYLVYLPCYP